VVKHAAAPVHPACPRHPPCGTADEGVRCPCAVAPTAASTAQVHLHSRSRARLPGNRGAPHWHAGCSRQRQGPEIRSRGGPVAATRFHP
jgi:hypothetical protein